MSESILTSTKQNLGLEETDTSFDAEVIQLINTAFAVLNQLGIGPDVGYAITDKTPTWDAFFGSNLKYNGIKTYVYLYTRLVFDPPQTSYLNQAMKEQKTELEVRLSYVREDTEWVDPDPDPIPDEELLVLDGGFA